MKLTARFTAPPVESHADDVDGVLVVLPSEPPFWDVSLNEAILFAAVGSAAVIASALGWF